jgi:ATP-dependent DNA helicase PIF1
VTRQFKNDYRVRKSAVKIWLDYLLRNHPGYSDVVIDAEKMDAFPTSDDVSDQLLQHLEEDEDVAVDLDNYPEEPPEAAAIPDLHAERSEIAGLRRDYFDSSNPLHRPPTATADPDSDILQSTEQDELAGQHPAALPHLSLGSIHATPINEFNRTQAIFSLAFPTLFPNGAAEFITPRMREIGLRDYIRHLLLYKDSRFAQHSRFRYIGFNMLMRHQINSKSGFFVKKMRPEQGDLTLDDLKMAFQEDTVEAEAIINQITRFSGTLRGTRPFWYGALKQLQSTVRQLGCPSLFITCSAADYHWDSLMRLMPGDVYQRFRDADTRDRRVRVARDAVKDNPLIVDFYFYRRFQLFKRHILKPKFNVVDSWDRFEYQARGSAHNHGLYWCDGVPPNEIENLSEEQRDHFAKF